MRVLSALIAVDAYTRLTSGVRITHAPDFGRANCARRVSRERRVCRRKIHPDLGGVLRQIVNRYPSPVSG